MEEKNFYPDEKSRKMIEELSHYVIAEPYPFVLDLQQCHGMYLTTVGGQKIFDWAGYYGSKLIGHNHPGLNEPEYREKLLIAANNKIANPDFLTEECLEYYRLIYRLAPACMMNKNLEVYTINSGAEAVENMIKYLINLYDEKMLKRGVNPQVRRLVYFDRAFHGRTIFALNVTQLSHDPIITKDFHGFIPGNLRVPFPSTDSSQSEIWNNRRTENSLSIIENCLRTYGEEVVAIICEPLQGAGGQRMAQPDFFRRLSKLAHDYDVFLGFDEVQTAGGQTGTMFAIDQFNLPYPPQAVATAKKFANGVVYMLNSMTDRGVLDSTWGGSLVDMVRFVQEMKIVRQEQLIEKVPMKAEYMVSGLNDLAFKYSNLIFNVRGMGLYQGFSMRNPANKNKLINMALQQHHMLLLGAGAQTIRLRPVLDVEIQDIESMLSKLNICLSCLQNG